MSKLNFKIDESKCIHCGLCEKICSTKVIKLDENKIPKAISPKNCMECQHCLAVCPVGAISVFDKNPMDSDQIYVQNPDMLLNLIKSRRSCRHYKPENLDRDILSKMKDMLKWTPTGCNYHGLHFAFVDDVEVMDEIRTHVMNKVVSALTKKPVKAVVEKFEKRAKDILDGKDVIFRGAPHMVVVSNSVVAPCAQQDPVIALSYMELYANSMGVGTCWCGYGEICLNLFPELCEYLKIPNGYKPDYVMLFGPKDVNFARTTQPKEYTITSVEKGEFKNISVIQKVKRYFWNIIR